MNDQTHALLERISSETNVFTKARLLQEANIDKQIRIKEIASYLKVSSPEVCMIMRLNKVPELVSDGYLSGSISLTHLYILSRLESEVAIIKAFETVLENGLTTAKTEDLIRETIHNVSSVGTKGSETIKKTIVDKFRQLDPNIEVKVVQTRLQARVEIKVAGNMTRTTRFLETLSKSDK